MATTAKFSKTYNSFSGVDMIVTFGGRWIGELQGISYSVTREKVPLFTMGSANPRAFSRGKRGIAGALVFALFDASALLEEMNKILVPVHDEDSQTYTVGYQPFKKEVFASAESGNLSEIKSTQQLAHYYDEILPFDVVISGSNEYGNETTMSIMGIELLNSGAGMSIDDIQTNETCSFLATDIVHWKKDARQVTGGRHPR